MTDYFVDIRFIEEIIKTVIKTDYLIKKDLCNKN